MLQSDRLRKLRQRDNYTLAELAKMLNLNTRQIARYEAGEADPLSDVVSRMAEIFEVSTDYLLGRTDDPTPIFGVSDFTQAERDILAALRRGEPFEAVKLIAAHY